MSDKKHRIFKDRLYAQLARLGKAVASAHRLEFLELLAQGERTVESLAAESETTIANASQHLRILLHVGLVETRKQGLNVFYRLADPSVYQLATALRTTSENRLSELDQLVRDHFGDRSDPEPVPIRELVKRAKSSSVVILDARPLSEYAAGHIAGAISVPIDDLHRRLGELPKTKKFVAYCRGPYCIYADRAVELLRASGRNASRLLEGFPEWQLAGHPTESGLPKAKRQESRR